MRGPATDEAWRAQVHQFYDEHGPGLLAYASSFLGNRTEGEDIVHQIFLKLLGEGVSINGDPKAYLYRAVRNTCLNYRRAAAQHMEVRPEEAWLEAPPRRENEALTLQAALNEIPSEQREIIVLRIWSGMTLHEASALLAIPLNTAASRYRYGLAKLRERLNPPGGRK